MSTPSVSTPMSDFEILTPTAPMRPAPSPVPPHVHSTGRNSPVPGQQGAPQPGPGQQGVPTRGPTSSIDEMMKGVFGPGVGRGGPGSANNSPNPPHHGPTVPGAYGMGQPGMPPMQPGMPPMHPGMGRGGMPGHPSFGMQPPGMGQPGPGMGRGMPPGGMFPGGGMGGHMPPNMGHMGGMGGMQGQGMGPMGGGAGMFAPPPAQPAPEMTPEEAERAAVEPAVTVKVRAWSEKGGKKVQVRGLLTTLHEVVWDASGWEKMSSGDVISPAQVKKAYRRAVIIVHPDKVTNGPLEQRLLAQRIFESLREAFDAFKVENGDV
eukprot:TRINITY_DN2071_c0_g1_i2.p1 TRINITY_DN2071_c0_g1~~TRINITY_DN2071_c0_g1_i2.p1  ORF type:complete len:368 (-),score=103.50 TRINITY_DN2071_c0_g1_i2:37-993(-)